ncbi:hypothetical protein NIBR502772_10965 [Pseudarthrobacter sp. NIBRBAC000502772]|uniref:P-loop NTPase fold protein n=1 Tax=Pseudarthrobacter sp. NIBRBAC000502772 TaxID=2590775 RepID=UPI0011326874|nr:P-loop NTPase fold protein [Pseudarthrobacter sp. NIBRBAC000502772]QDG66661.1 hypothetical protein NIBR502772_10965 [Pseudarthrobacter sp. NIBRBAC000502772]
MSKGEKESHDMVEHESVAFWGVETALDEVKQQEGIQKRFRQLLQSDPFRHYQMYESELDQALQRFMPTLIILLAPERKEFVRWTNEYASLSRKVPRQSVRFVVRLLGPLIASAVGVLTPLTYGGLFREGVGMLQVLTLLLVALATISSVAASYFYLRRRRWDRLRADEAYLQLQVSHVKYSQEAEMRVNEAFTRILNEVLGPKGKLAFPTFAPRLVELDNSALVASASILYLRDFVGGHESSAIGIAGPRGSGKSTVMRAIRDDQSLDPHYVSLTAPVRYDATEFIRRLYLDVALMIDEHNGSTFKEMQQGRARRVTSVRLLVGVLAITIGSMIVVWDLLITQLALSFIRFSPVTLLGAAIAGFGLLAYINVLVGVRGRTSNETKSARLARDAIQDLRFDSEMINKSKNVTKLFDGYLSLEDEDSLTLKGRALSQADLVNGLRVLLRTFADDQKPNPVVIGVDELDKISETEDLIETVNGLKDLFHIEGVHFVVSVSTDALLSFERRGLPSRDAFDSAFDAIIRVKPLALDESLRVLAARAAGFPPLVGAFCHSWAGGLPRDLLRVARRCVELQRSYGTPLSVDMFVRTIISEDLIAILEGQLNAPDLSATDQSELWALRERIIKLRMINPEPPNLNSADPSIGVAQLLTLLGEALVGYFSRTSEEPSNWSSLDVEDKNRFELTAHAMSKRGEMALIRSEAFEAAVLALSS